MVVRAPTLQCENKNGSKYCNSHFVQPKPTSLDKSTFTHIYFCDFELCEVKDTYRFSN